MVSFSLWIIAAILILTVAAPIVMTLLLGALRLLIWICWILTLGFLWPKKK